MTDPITKAHAAVDYVHSEHRRQIRDKNRQINALQAEKGELQRALQAKTAEVVKAKMQAKTAYDDAIRSEESRPPAVNLVKQMAAAYKSADNDMAPVDGDTLIVWKGRDWWEVGVALPGRPLDKRLARVLHRPSPARPEVAEAIQAAFDTWENAEYLNGGIDEDDKRALADHIAEEMNR